MYYKGVLACSKTSKSASSDDPLSEYFKREKNLPVHFLHILHLNHNPTLGPSWNLKYSSHRKNLALTSHVFVFPSVLFWIYICTLNVMNRTGIHHSRCSYTVDPYNDITRLAVLFSNPFPNEFYYSICFFHHCCTDVFTELFIMPPPKIFSLDNWDSGPSCVNAKLGVAFVLTCITLHYLNCIYHLADHLSCLKKFYWNFSHHFSILPSLYSLVLSTNLVSSLLSFKQVTLF